MKRKTTWILAIVALVTLSSLALAQTGKKKLPREAEKRETAPVSLRADPKISSVEPGSPELNRALADKKFIDACMILATSGEMFLAESAQLSRDGEKFAVAFNVVNEGTQEPGQYRQLVYAFDGKESAAYFDGENEKYVQRKSISGSASKLQWPPPTPKWWPSSAPVPPWPGSGGGTIGVGRGFEWGDWYQKSIDSCHYTAVPACSPLHAGKMREDERISKANSTVKQTRWVLLHCGC